MAQRSKEAPMDWQYTSRPYIKPAWSSSNDESSTPRKRPHDHIATQVNTLTPTFGANQNIPFMFNQAPVSPSPQTQPWAPPPLFSPSKAFPIPEVNDVDMAEASPPKPAEETRDGKRAVAAGALRRVYKSRQKSQLSRSKEISDDEEESDNSDGEKAVTHKTSNHYTLNMPSPAAATSDMPYILLGYLQFFFNLSLILVFLYLILQFILTVQRDVEHRISEYSMDIVQDIAACALEYEGNGCDRPPPALARQCNQWRTCMNRDPTIVGRARVGAELIAEVVNGFVEPISWKTLAFTLTSLSFLTLFINTLLSLYRARHHPAPSNAQVAVPPAMGYPDHYFGGQLSPAPTPRWTRTWHGNEEPQTPSRRRRLEGGNVAKIK